ncbi:MAG: TolC family protein, partial [Candidatus Eremiobacteraeota bacterium]|nr:TolC family protein [Candidatus Eremiobacteraeota bacterium]
MRSALIGLALLIGFTLPAFADTIVYSGALSKAQAVARVTTQGFDVQAAQADLEAARARSATARSALLPHVSLTAVATNAHLPQLGMPVAQQAYLSGTASVPLFSMALSTGARAAGIAALAAADDLAGARNDAAFAVYQAYDRAVLAGAVVHARDVSVADQQGNVARMSLLVRAGRTARYELVRAQASLAQSQQAREDADAQLDEAMNALKVLLDFDLSSKIELSDGLGLVPFSEQLANLLGRARVQRPELAAAKSRLDAAALTLRQTRSSFVPAASLSAQTYNGASTPSLGSMGSQLSAQLSIPLVDGGSRSAAVAQADSDLAKANIEYNRRSLMVQA